jgi:hypothetical protein
MIRNRLTTGILYITVAVVLTACGSKRQTAPQSADTYIGMKYVSSEIVEINWFIF